MADISKVVLPNDSTTYNIISKTGRGIIHCETGDTSTSTAFVVTAPGITELYDGIILSIKNTVVTSATNCTLSLNGLGAKRIWLSLDNSYCTSHWSKNATYFFIYDATNDRWELQQGGDINVRQTLTSGNANRPILLSHAGSTTTTTNVDSTTYRNNSIYANPSTGTITATKFVGDISDGTIDKSGFSKHTWTNDPTVHAVLVSLESELVSGIWTKFGVGNEISLSNLYVTGLAYSSKYIEGSIYLSKPIDSYVDTSNTTISGGKIALYGANGQILGSTATYPTYSLSILRDLGVITVKFTLSTSFNTANNNKPATIWFDSGAKLTLG